MKTGRLLKFRRPGAQVQAYLYQEQGRWRAAVYDLSTPAETPVHAVEAEAEAEAERLVREFVDRLFPVHP